MSRYSHIPKKPFEVGDKVYVCATITEICDDDPHDPSVTVWFNGDPHVTTVMNLRHNTEGKIATRIVPAMQPDREFVDVVLDSDPPGIAVEELLDKVATPADYPKNESFGPRARGGDGGFMRFEPGDFTGKSVGEDPDVDD